MKKKLIVALVATLMIFVAACGKTDKPETVKPEENNNPISQQNTNSGEQQTSENGDSEEAVDYFYMEAPEAGFAVPYPQNYVDNMDKVFLYAKGYKLEQGLYEMYTYLYPMTYDELMGITEEEGNAIDHQIINLFNLYRADSSWTPEDLMDWMSIYEWKENPVITEVGKDGEYTIYLYKETEISEDLDPERKAIYEAIVAEIPGCLEKVKYSEPKPEEEENTGVTLSFTTTDTEGNTVTSSEIFGKAEYTMVNCWASWCGPCIGELAEIEELNKSFMEKGGQVIGVLMDGSSGGLEDAKEIMESTGVTYLNIIDWAGINQQIQIQAYPTTFFVDKNGVIIDDAVIGAAPDRYERIMNRLLG